MNYDKTEMNDFVQRLYNQKMQEGKHGHYETLFHVVHKAIERAQQAQPVSHWCNIHGPIGIYPTCQGCAGNSQRQQLGVRDERNLRL